MVIKRDNIVWMISDGNRTMNGTSLPLLSLLANVNDDDDDDDVVA
jgi:hypothetical protein